MLPGLPPASERLSPTSFLPPGGPTENCHLGSTVAQCLSQACSLPLLQSSLPGAFSSSPRKNDRWEYPHRGSPPTQRGWPFKNTWKTISQLVSLSLRYMVWKITLEDTFTKTPNWLLPLGPHLWFPVSRKWGQVSSDFLDLAQSPSWDVVWPMLKS